MNETGHAEQVRVQIEIGKRSTCRHAGRHASHAARAADQLLRRRGTLYQHLRAALLYPGGVADELNEVA